MSMKSAQAGTLPVPDKRAAEATQGAFTAHAEGLQWQALLAMSVGGILTNKARTLLTLLGVIIGVASVITAVAIGQGSQAAVTNSINGLGTNLLSVSSAASFSGGVRGAAGSASTVTMADATTMEEEATPGGALPDVSLVAPEDNTNVQVVYNAQNASTSADGVTPAYLTARNWQVAQGRFIDQQDVTAETKVVDIGASVISDLFSGQSTNPVGLTIELNGEPYQIIGVMASKGSTGGQNQDDTLFVPITTVQNRLTAYRGSSNRVSDINVVAASQSAIPAAEAEVTALLRAMHKLQPTAANDFNIISQTQVAQIVSSVSGTLTVLLGAIAAVALLVGGIGIMNIMLVTVTERTREIGLRKAIGARKADILLQFLAESTMISGLGGLMGVVLSFVLAWVLPIVTKGTSLAMNPLISNASIVEAVAVSVGIGLFFGSYPASRAAGLDPITALRYE